MSFWIWSTQIALLFGVLFFAAILIPILIRQYRKYGRLSRSRIFSSIAITLYITALLAYTLLPLPSGDTAQWCASYGYDGAQLVPFQFVSDIMTTTAGLSWVERLRSIAVLQVVFNVLLFIPLGAVLRRISGLGIFTATGVALMTSFVIEVTQLTGIYGLVGCSYRLADVDDLMLNTLGGFLGAILAPLLLGWVQSDDELEKKRHTPRPITVWRRWMGMIFDWFIFFTLSTVLTLALRITVALFTGVPLLDDPAFVLSEYLFGVALPVILVFLLPAWLGSGATIGQRVVWLEPVRQGQSLRLPRRLLRGFISSGLFGIAVLMSSMPESLNLLGEEIIGWAGLAQTLIILVSVSAVPLTAKMRGLSGLLSATTLRDAREAHAVAGSPR